MGQVDVTSMVAGEMGDLLSLLEQREELGVNGPRPPDCFYFGGLGGGLERVAFGC